MTDRSSAQRRGAAVLADPLRNKGTAFSAAERRAFGLDGMLPPAIETLEQRATRAYEALAHYPDDLAKHVYLRSVQDRDEVLFSKLLVEHAEELLPIVYTPTVGLGCQQFSRIYRRHRGLFLSYPFRDRLPELLGNRPTRDVRVVVVTDGQRILGLGDQGAGGLGIPIGKLSLYTAIGGIHPAGTLPIVLDVGTDNEELLSDPEYLGWRHERIDGDAYVDFVDRFVQAVKTELPGVLLQWEDFSTAHARPILDRYRDELLTFNDDIQGTAAAVAGTLVGAVQVAGSRMRDQRVVFAGAGSAAIGVADMVRQLMVADGASDDEARRRFYIVDVKGLLTADRTDLREPQRPYAHDPRSLAGWDLAGRARPGLSDVVANVDATVLVGLSTAGGAFTEPIVRQMAAKVERPVILPLSNPTSHSEADPADLDRWTGGRALVATGSPYPPMRVGGRRVRVAQCNNVYVFPAVGLGVLASGATRVTETMMLAAATSLGGLSPALASPAAPLLPAIGELRATAATVAAAVAAQAVEDGTAPPAGEEELRARIGSTQWYPAYPDPEV